MSRLSIIGFVFASLLCLASTEGYPDGPRGLPAPKYEVRAEQSVLIPMRDGVKLSTDLYFPKNVSDRLPVILIRTPYDKSYFGYDPYSDEKNMRPAFSSAGAAHVFSGQGYVVAVQDVRGKFESGGEFLASGNDVNDGFDTIDWLAKQSWSTGKIGMYGCSYAGDTQIMAVKSRNSHLAAVIPQAAGSSIGSAGDRRRYLGARNGGAVELAAAAAWSLQYGSKIYLQVPAYVSREAWLRNKRFFDLAPTTQRNSLSEGALNKILWSLPIVDALAKADAPPTDYEGFVSHEISDPWFDQFGYLTDGDRFDTPSLQINSWYDFGVAETLYQFNLFQRNALSSRGRDNQFFVISPTTHCGSEQATAHTLAGNREVGDARFDYYALYLQWFNYWLKGIDNGVTKKPKIQLYVMGRNQWRSENEWPLARTQFTNYYFDGEGRANSRFGDGQLTVALPREDRADHYTYDPATPVPTTGGALCCTAEPSEGAADQSGVETRNDVLVYTTPPLEHGVEITGPLQVVLYASSSARDTDFTGKLVDVYPDGAAFNLRDGILRSRYREGFAKRVWMTAGEVYEIKIDLEATSNYFAAGHRIRVEIASSNFPRFDRNLNTGGRNYDEGTWVVAHNSIFHSPKYPSHIILPVIPESDTGAK